MAEDNKKLEGMEMNDGANQASEDPKNPEKTKLIDKIPKPVKMAAKIAAGTVVAGVTVFGAFVLGRAAGFKDGVDTNTVVIEPSTEEPSREREEHD